MIRQQRKPRARLASKLHGGALFSGIVALVLMISLVMTGCSSTVTISSVAVSDITVTGATITWETSGSAVSQVEFGTTTSYGSEVEAANSPLLASGSLNQIAGQDPLFRDKRRDILES